MIENMMTTPEEEKYLNNNWIADLELELVEAEKTPEGKEEEIAQLKLDIQALKDATDNTVLSVE